MNPGAARALGLKPPFLQPNVGWRWVDRPRTSSKGSEIRIDLRAQQSDPARHAAQVAPSAVDTAPAHPTC
jgi:hypothetical protein